MSERWIQVEWEVTHTDVGHAVVDESFLEEFTEAEVMDLDFDHAEVTYGEHIKSGPVLRVIATDEDGNDEILWDAGPKSLYSVSMVVVGVNSYPETYVSPTHEYYVIATSELKRLMEQHIGDQRKAYRVNAEHMVEMEGVKEVWVYDDPQTGAKFVFRIHEVS